MRDELPTVVVVVVIIAVVLIIAVYGQEAPSLSEVEQLRVQLVKLTDQLATCQAQANTINVRYLSGETVKQIEAAHPGWTVNWDTGALMKKDAPKEIVK